MRSASSATAGSRRSARATRASNRSGWRSMPGEPPGTPTGRSGRSRASLRKGHHRLRLVDASRQASPSRRPRTAPSGLPRRLPSASRVSRMGCSPGTRWARSPRPRSAWPSPGRHGLGHASQGEPARAPSTRRPARRAGRPYARQPARRRRRRRARHRVVPRDAREQDRTLRRGTLQRVSGPRPSQASPRLPSPRTAASGSRSSGPPWPPARRCGDRIALPGEMRGPSASPSTRPAMSGTRTSPAGSAASPPSAPAGDSGPVLATLVLPGRLNELTVVFVSIVLQSLPFILLGVLASALVQEFLSDELLGRWLPRGRLPVILLASIFGFIAPVCDCGVIRSRAGSAPRASRSTRRPRSSWRRR